MAKKIAVIGARGGVGRLIMKKLVESDDFTPFPFVRKREQLEELEKECGVKGTCKNIEDSSVEEIAELIKGCDALVFTAGQGGKGPVERIFSVDLDGAIKATEACEMAGVKQLVIVSALGTDNRKLWEETGLRYYFIAKKSADVSLETSTLDYTILQPGALLSGEKGTGLYTLPDEVESKAAIHYAVEREDVAAAIFYSLSHPQAVKRKRIPLVNGDRSISELIAAL
ncbi:uncharacterized protein Ecym_3399 [Eremothecium cymbalariae DBVPG|uniref:NAD(P)-binding domain-containing protein n=1 Tax=Eremothecium cymbalariae (strain CBS 270.75 / DBVPG 7215 / KCTC 17166 / NRRL Y-17582) TaxID=931890 RepID=G8JRW7_ERECY|nr:Hypothetical protein Ecym_3399 [Eremothecium cymbalariae DBVPG\